MQVEPIYRPFGRRAILIEWPAKIDNQLLDELLQIKHHLEKYYSKPKVEIINTYNTITVFYNYDIDNIYNEI